MAIIQETLDGQLSIVVIDGLSFAELRLANLVRDREWDPSHPITLEFRGNELGGECGEAQNIIKKLARARLGVRGTTATVEDLAEDLVENLARKLADVVICADLIAMAIGVDLGKMVREKFNESSDRLDPASRLKENAQDQSQTFEGS